MPPFSRHLRSRFRVSRRSPSAASRPEGVCGNAVHLPCALLCEHDLDLAIDVHGDEAIPHVFLAGFEGIPGWSEALKAGFDRYKAILERRTPDFQTRRGYPVAAAGKANLTMATNHVAQRFGCVAMTLEMPFKDNDDLPCAAQGWSPERSKLLGRDCLGALLEWLSV